MYCIKCGVKLADTENKCPLCNTVPGTYVREQKNVRPLYPKNNYPTPSIKPQAMNGSVLILFLIPLFITFFVDLQRDGEISWFVYVAGAITLGYLFFALPCWFKKPNPVVFVPCDFAAIAVYLFLINMMTSGNWFYSFALPVTLGTAIIVTAVVVLTRYLKKGRLYVIGGAFMAFGAFMILIELIINYTFGLSSSGWSVYTLISQFLFGGMLIYIAINKSFREKMERRFFF